MKRRNSDVASQAAGEAAGSGEPPPVKRERSGEGEATEPEDDLEFRLTRFENPESGELLLAATELFKKQLPKMPAPYIMKHVLDFPNHRTLVVIDKQVQRRAQHSGSAAAVPGAVVKPAVVGGICFRTFALRGFIEIVFCAVLTSCQGRGVGRRMMNKLKDVMKSEHIFCFLTCAANEAVPYFRNMGFSDRITTPQSRYVGYIEEYNRVTLMECLLDKRIESYSTFNTVLRSQCDELFNAIEQKTQKQMKFGPMPKDTRFPIPLAKVPGVSKEGVEAIQRTTPDQEKLKNDMRALLSRVRAHGYAKPFLEPVDVKVVTDYLTIIKNPIDLRTIGEKIEKGLYITMNMMCADLQLMIDNCKTYNDEKSYFYTAAVAIEHDFSAELKDLQDF